MKFTALTIIAIIPVWLFCQNPIASGLNSQGLADTSIWCVSSNPSQSAFISSPQIGVGVANHYLLPELNTYYTALTYPVGKATLSADFKYYGFSVWQEKQAGLSVAHQLSDKISLAAKCTGMFISHGDEAESEQYFIPEVSGSFYVSDYVGLFASAGFGQFMYDDIDPVQESGTSLGAAYYFSAEFSGTAEVHYNELSELEYSASAIYNLNRYLIVRGGISPGVEPFAGGLTCNLSWCAVDVSATYHKHLGTMTSIGLRIGSDASRSKHIGEKTHSVIK